MVTDPGRMLMSSGAILVSAAVLFAVAPAAVAAGTAAEDGADVDTEARRVIFSTDLALGLVNGRFDGPGAPPIDDAYAVALAAGHPERFDVRGLVVTHGNAIMAPELIAATRLVDALGIDLPVVAGAAVPLAEPSVTWHDGSPLEGWCVNDGVRFMAEELRQGPATILAIGSLTDIGCLIRNFPNEAENVEEVVALLGARPGTALELGGTPVPDLNFTTDPVALSIVLEESDIPFTAMTFEVSAIVDFDIDALIPWADEGNAVAAYFHAASVPNTAQWDTTSFEIFDVHTVYRLLRPEAYSCDEGGYALQIGQPAVVPTPANDDRFGPDLPGRRVLSCSAFAQEGEDELMLDTLLTAIVDLGS